MLKGAKLYTISFETPPDTLRLINLDFSHFKRTPILSLM